MSLKVRRKRNKFHITAPKLKPSEKDDMTVPLLGTTVPAIPSDFMNKLSFVSLTASKDELNKEEEKKNDSKKQIKKKDKRKLRHNKWMEKIEATKKAKEMVKAALKRKRTVITGDMEPLLSSLPEIKPKVVEETVSFKKKKKKKRKGVSHSSVFKERELFQQVLTHPSYQADPVGTISVHIKNATALNKI